MYAALRAEGFTEQQALVIIGQILAASGQGPGLNDGKPGE